MSIDLDKLPETVLIALPEPYIDARGVIQPLVDREMHSAAIIESKKGAVRANHYHKTDWHYCYVLKGKIEYRHRPAGSSADPEVVMIGEGGMFFSPPLQEHVMIFHEDTTFLVFSRNERHHQDYESDVVRVTLA